MVGLIVWENSRMVGRRMRLSVSGLSSPIWGNSCSWFVRSRGRVVLIL